MLQFYGFCGSVRKRNKINAICGVKDMEITDIKNLIKKVFKGLCKIALSGILAFIVLTAFCIFYYNVPVRAENKDGSTDYKRIPNAFYSRATEGFAYGKTNNEGFVELIDYDENTPPIDVLIIGSSHMEGLEVALKDSVTGVLGRQKTVYNLGTSGHTFITCCGNLEAAAKKYRPKYIVMETGDCLFSDSTLTEAVNGTTPEIPAQTGGIVGLLQRNQYLRLVYAQIGNYMGNSDNEQNGDTGNAAPAEEEKTDDRKSNDELLSALLQKISAIARQYNSKLIIVYHPGTFVRNDGSLYLTGNKTAADQFGKACRSNGIYYLDLSDRFTREFKENHRLPFGFANTPVGLGHLNKYGHAMMADELYKLISEVE